MLLSDLQFVLHHGLKFVEAVSDAFEGRWVDGVDKLTVVIVVR